MTLNNLGQALLMQGKCSGAKKAFERALAMQLRLFGSSTDHPHITVTLNNLACAHQAKGELRHAVVLLERALAMQRRLAGASVDTPVLAAALSNLSRLHEELGGIDKAIALLQESVAMRRRLQHGVQADTSVDLSALPLADSVENAAQLYHLGSLHEEQANRATSLGDRGAQVEAAALRVAQALFQECVAMEERLGVVGGSMGQAKTALVDVQERIQAT